MMSDTEQARKFRARAARLRALARWDEGANVQRSLVKIAQTYDDIAELLDWNSDMQKDLGFSEKSENRGDPVD